jgi:hypothetical protein
MLRTKPVSFNATTIPKSPKTNNVSINVIFVVTTYSEQSKQHVFKEREPVEAKGAED